MDLFRESVGSLSGAPYWQRCSLEFLEDIVECASVRRTKHISGSPRHKGLKKVHFIKNMRQYDTKNSRIVLICAKRTLCVAFSILPYGESLRIRQDNESMRMNQFS
ncbi:UNVERIFIED_CONTAM: CDK5 and ABL1 enzyme substrate 2 [Gekko kuhli]